MKIDPRGGCIVLNGSSSSGKSTIGRAMQAKATEPWMHVEIDAFIKMCRLDLIDESSLEVLLAGIHRAVGALAAAGNRVIFDTVLQEKSWVTGLAEALNEVPTILVGVRCPEAVLDERERARGDRQIGLAKSQAGVVHSHGPYDVEVDTADANPDACAELILGRWRSGPGGALKAAAAAAMAR